MSNLETPEARELSLVGKVEMRIALANDASLTKTLNIYLAPLLLKLTSEFVSVRNKVSIHHLPTGYLSKKMAVVKYWHHPKSGSAAETIDSSCMKSAKGVASTAKDRVPLSPAAGLPVAMPYFSWPS